MMRHLFSAAGREALAALVRRGPLLAFGLRGTLGPGGARARAARISGLSPRRLPRNTRTVRLATTSAATCAWASFAPGISAIAAWLHVGTLINSASPIVIDNCSNLRMIVLPSSLLPTAGVPPELATIAGAASCPDGNYATRLPKRVAAFYCLPELSPEWRLLAPIKRKPQVRFAPLKPACSAAFPHSGRSAQTAGG